MIESLFALPQPGFEIRHLETTVLEIDVFAFSIGLGLGPTLFLRLGQNALGVEPGAGDHVLCRYPVTLPTTSNGETGKEIAEAQTEDDPKDRQPDDGDGFHGRSPFPVGE